MSDESTTTTGTAEVRVEGSTLDEMLAAASEAFFSKIIDIETVREREEHYFSIPWQGTSETVLNDFLQECLTALREEKFLARSCEIDVDSDELLVTLRGSTYNPAKHTLIADIKGIEDDSLMLREDVHGTFEAEFTVDL